MADRKPVLNESGELALPDISPMSRLTIALVTMLDEAAELPEPVSLSVYAKSVGLDSDIISLHFPASPDSRKALLLWAARFGSNLITETVEAGTGSQEWARVEFTYRNAVRVGAFANITLPDEEASTITPV